MARYWMYLDGQVEGPFGVEQLIRKRGFSRQTLVCVEDPSGKPQHWISPADIPELAHIFKAIDDKAAEPAPVAPRPSLKRAPQAARAYTPAVTLKQASGLSAGSWGWILLTVMLIGGGVTAWFMQSHRSTENHARQEARRLIENMRISGNGPYGTLGQYLQEKDIKPRWDFEKKIEGLYNTSLSWYAKGARTGHTQTVYAFEVNTQAQTVRALNSAAVRLLSGALFPAAPVAAAPKPEAPKKDKPVSFDGTVNGYVEALQAGDFQAVWSNFSKRKTAEMAKGGISREGFVRLQSLTHRLESGAATTLVKTKDESPTERLVLLKHSQPGHSDVLIKQLWIHESGQWKLDDEEKRGAPTAETSTPVERAPESPAPPLPKVAPTALPGMSN